VQQLHRITEQDLGVQIATAVDREQIVQVECERRIGEAQASRRITRRQTLVAPTGVGCDEIQEEIDL